MNLAVVLGACDRQAQPDPVQVEIATSTGSVDYDPSEFTVPAGAEVAVVFNNDDVFTEHDLLIASGVIQSEDDAKTAAAASADSTLLIGKSDIVNPENSDTFVVSFDSPGEYQFFCTVGLDSTAPSHFEAGMRGTIIVEG
ncbi:MAG: plastocyanin/azurin family copper-binding protein [Actinomycetota bacterium]